MTTPMLTIITMTTFPIPTATDLIIPAPSSGWDFTGGIRTSTGIHSITTASTAITTDIIPAIIITVVPLIMAIIPDMTEYPPAREC